jgi:hypothetical protein
VPRDALSRLRHANPAPPSSPRGPPVALRLVPDLQGRADVGAGVKVLPRTEAGRALAASSYDLAATDVSEQIAAIEDEAVKPWREFAHYVYTWAMTCEADWPEQRDTIEPGFGSVARQARALLESP